MSLTAIILMLAVPVNALDITPEVAGIYAEHEIQNNSVSNFDLKVYEHEHENTCGNRDHNFEYKIYATEIMNEQISYQLLDSGSGDVDWHTIKVPTTVTKIECYFSGESQVYIWAGPFPIGYTDASTAWWKNQKGVLYQYSYPNYSSHSIEFSSVKANWPNYNDPYIRIDGHDGVFSDSKSMGYGWFWDI
jgi:hypothetical protein